MLLELRLAYWCYEMLMNQKRFIRAPKEEHTDQLVKELTNPASSTRDKSSHQQDDVEELQFVQKLTCEMCKL